MLLHVELFMLYIYIIMLNIILALYSLKTLELLFTNCCSGTINYIYNKFKGTFAFLKTICKNCSFFTVLNEKNFFNLHLSYVSLYIIHIWRIYLSLWSCSLFIGKRNIILRETVRDWESFQPGEPKVLVA